jgi:hypothetical protein
MNDRDRIGATPVTPTPPFKLRTEIGEAGAASTNEQCPLGRGLHTPVPNEDGPTIMAVPTPVADEDGGTYKTLSK